MREDMYKVIVERPRHGRYRKSEYPCPQDLEESPSHEGLKKRHRYRKSLNENLNPLKRFLAKQVNRPWDKVFSELCQNIDRRNTVQQHIHQHIDDFVARELITIDGELCTMEYWGPSPLSGRGQSKLYVDPDTGILRKNIFRESTRAEEKLNALAEEKKRNSKRRALDKRHQLLQLSGLWYFVTVDTVPVKPDKETIVRLKNLGLLPMDVIRKQPAWDCQCHCCGYYYRRKECSNQQLFGNCQLYASAKRQLNSRELSRYGLHN
ncbi:MAG: hypothetical protein ACREPB_02105, partial [Arenimonas sp.]